MEKEFSWHETGKLNTAYEAIDKHANSTRKNKVALYYRDAQRNEKYTFKEMKEWSNKAANVLKQADVEKGDRVFIFMPRSPELYFALLGAVKLGAIVGPLFEAFMEGAVNDRLQDSDAKVLITTPELLSRVPVKDLPALKHILLVGENVEEDRHSIRFSETIMKRRINEVEIEWVDREDGMLLHYTSGSTGKPKGVLHVHNAMIQHYQTAKWVLDLKDDDVYWCTADPGWVTGTSYGIFGPWLAGATNVIVGGRFSPDAWYQALEDYNVTVWYSAPTAFRMLMGAGDDLVKHYDLCQSQTCIKCGRTVKS